MIGWQWSWWHLKETTKCHRITRQCEILNLAVNAWLVSPHSFYCLQTEVGSDGSKFRFPALCNEPIQLFSDFKPEATGSFAWYELSDTEITWNINSAFNFAQEGYRHRVRLKSFFHPQHYHNPPSPPSSLLPLPSIRFPCQPLPWDRIRIAEVGSWNPSITCQTTLESKTQDREKKG